MIKKICFFSVGFAFNRLVRMRYYEKIFPKDTEIFLYTTNKYQSKEECKKQWDLKRAKVFVEDYNSMNTPFKLRKFCNHHKIDRLVNLGHPGAGIPFLIASLFSNRDYLMGFYGQVAAYKREKKYSKKIRKFFVLIVYWFVAQFAKKLVFTDKESLSKAPRFFLISKKKMYYAEAPVNTDLFLPKNRISARKKLKLPLDKNIILRVGRANYIKCGDIFKSLVEKNPGIFFILIGEWFENEVPKINKKNFLHINKMSSKELVDYYNSADLALSMHRAGTGMGIVAEEALSCGIPIILPNKVTTPDSKSIIRSSTKLEEINDKMNKFLLLPKKEKQEISKEARNYAQKYYSDDVWKKEFVKFHLD